MDQLVASNFCRAFNSVWDSERKIFTKKENFAIQVLGKNFPYFERMFIQIYPFKKNKLFLSALGMRMMFIPGDSIRDLFIPKLEVTLTTFDFIRVTWQNYQVKIYPIFFPRFSRRRSSRLATQNIGNKHNTWCVNSKGGPQLTIIILICFLNASPGHGNLKSRLIWAL